MVTTAAPWDSTAIRCRPCDDADGAASSEFGVIARRRIAAGEKVWSSRDYILSVLYTPQAATHCASCFSRSEDKVWECRRCGSFRLCAACVEDDAKRWHQLEGGECDLFCSVPAGLRRGDTDYLRFVARWFAMCKVGPPPRALPGSKVCEAPEHIRNAVVARAGGEGPSSRASRALDVLATNRALQPREYLDWCEGFAKLFGKYVAFPEGVETSDLVDLFCRIRTNGLGFPCSDAEGTLGWSLDVNASFFNHACAPNCRVDMDEAGALVIIADEEVPEGEELFISYVANDDRTKEERREHLFDLYRFWCACSRCKGKKC